MGLRRVCSSARRRPVRGNNGDPGFSAPVLIGVILAHGRLIVNTLLEHIKRLAVRWMFGRSPPDLSASPFFPARAGSPCGIQELQAC